MESFRRKHTLQVVNKDVLHQLKIHLIAVPPNGEGFPICQQNWQIFNLLFSIEGQNLESIRQVFTDLVLSLCKIISNPKIYLPDQLWSDHLQKHKAVDILKFLYTPKMNRSWNILLETHKNWIFHTLLLNCHNLILQLTQSK